MALELISGYSPAVSADSDGEIVNVSRVYYVKSDDSPADIELQVLNFVDLPSIGDSISANYAGVRVDKITVDPADASESGDFFLWNVTVTYTNESEDGGGNKEDKLQEKPIINFGSQQYQRTVDKSYRDDDVEGEPTKPIQNSIGDPFDPPVQVPFSNQYVTIQQNLDKFDPTWIKDFENSTNASSMKIASIEVGPEQARMLSISATPQYDINDNEYWVVGYEIEISKEGFEKEILNAGFNFFESGEGRKPARYKDIPGNSPTAEGADDFVTDPVKIDEDGEIIDPNSEQDVIYLPFKVYFPKKWETLNIPKDV